MESVLLGFMDAMEYAFDCTMQQALASAATKVKASAVTLTLLLPLLTPAEPLLSTASHVHCNAKNRRVLLRMQLQSSPRRGSPESASGHLQPTFRIYKSLEGPPVTWTTHSSHAAQLPPRRALTGL